MSARKKNIIPKKTPSKRKKVTLYGKILKEFTKVNNDLPIERQLSIKDRRKYIKEVLIPKYKGASPYRVAVKTINADIIGIYNKIPPQVGCDVNLLSPATFASINFFELDDYIQNVLPKCIFIRIDAKQFGKTKIFNTLNYTYEGSGIRSIVENVREYMENARENNMPYDISLTGVRKLKSGKTNDGTPENYFIDFILVIDGEPQDDVTPVDYQVPKKKMRTLKSVRKVINERVRQLILKKKRKRNARKTAIKNLNQIKKLGKKQRMAVRQTTKDKLYKEKAAVSLKSYKQLEAAYNKGLLTPEQYQRFKDEITNRLTQERKKGGKI